MKYSLSTCHTQLNPAVTDVKGPIDLMCYGQIFVIANIVDMKKYRGGTNISYFIYIIGIGGFLLLLDQL